MPDRVCFGGVSLFTGARPGVASPVSPSAVARFAVPHRHACYGHRSVLVDMLTFRLYNGGMTTNQTPSIPNVEMLIAASDDIGRLAAYELQVMSWAPLSTRSRALPLTDALAEAVNDADALHDDENAEQETARQAVVDAYVAWDEKRTALARQVAEIEAKHAKELCLAWDPDDDLEERPEPTDDYGPSKGYTIDWEARTITGWAIPHHFWEDETGAVEVVVAF